MKTSFLCLLLPVLGVSIAFYALWSEARYYRDVECVPIPLHPPLGFTGYPCTPHSPYPATVVIVNGIVNLPPIATVRFGFPQFGPWRVSALSNARSFLLLSGVACWWLLIGLELDLGLLRRMAIRSTSCHYLWLAFGTLLQLLAVYAVLHSIFTWSYADSDLRFPLLGCFCWSQLLALFFLRSR